MPHQPSRSPVSAIPWPLRPLSQLTFASTLKHRFSHFSVQTSTSLQSSERAYVSSKDTQLGSGRAFLIPEMNPSRGLWAAPRGLTREAGKRQEGEEPGYRFPPTRLLQKPSQIREGLQNTLFQGILSSWRLCSGQARTDLSPGPCLPVCSSQP